MNPAEILYLAQLAGESSAAVVVEKVSDNLMFVGYCSPDCTSENDKRWMIKRILTTSQDGKETQTILYSNGSKAMNVAWSDRENIIYKPTEGWK